MGAFDSNYDESYLSSIPGSMRPPAGFLEAAGYGIDLAKQATPFGGMLDMGDKRYNRAKVIHDLTGDHQLFQDLVGNYGDPRVSGKIPELAKRYPGFVKTDDQLLEELKTDYYKKRQDAAYALQHTTTGGTLGNVVGSMAGMVLYDPTLWLTIPLGANAASGILLRSLAEAGINGVAEIASIAASSSWRKRMDDPITGDEFVSRTFMATGIGGVFGVGAGLLARLEKARAISANAIAPTRLDPPVAATTGRPASARTIIDLGENDRALASHGYRTVSEVGADIEGELARLGTTLEQWQATRDLEAQQLKYQTLIDARFDEIKNLDRSAPSYYRRALEKDIEDLTFWKEQTNDLLARDAEVARIADPYPHVFQEEIDAARILDDMADLERTRPRETTFQNHVIQLGKAIDDIETDRMDQTFERMGGPDDFPKAPQAPAAETKTASQWDEAANGWQREYDELLAKNPDRQTGVPTNQAAKMRDMSFDTGPASRIIEDLQLQESEIAAVKACLIGGGE